MIGENHPGRERGRGGAIVDLRQTDICSWRTEFPLLPLPVPFSNQQKFPILPPLVFPALSHFPIFTHDFTHDSTHLYTSAPPSESACANDSALQTKSDSATIWSRAKKKRVGPVKRSRYSWAIRLRTCSFTDNSQDEN